MTSSQLKFNELQENARHNLEQERVQDYQAKTARKKMIADTVLGSVGAVTSAINPSVGLINYLAKGTQVPSVKITRVEKGGN